MTSGTIPALEQSLTDGIQDDIIDEFYIEFRMAGPKDSPTQIANVKKRRGENWDRIREEMVEAYNQENGTKYTERSIIITETKKL